MRWFRYVEQDDNGNPRIVRCTEQQVREEYFPTWEKNMIKKFGKKEYEHKYTFEHCIHDFIVINWAEEVVEAERQGKK